MSEYWNDGMELYHYGIPGQKKGVRRWQNPDGTFNEEGKKRYGRIGLGRNKKKLSELSDEEFAKKYRKTNGAFLLGQFGLASADVAQNIYNLKRSFIPKREANIQLGMTLTRAALIALSARYDKELSRRTGTKTFTFNNEQLRKKEKYLKEHGGMNRIQEHFYDKRNK